MAESPKYPLADVFDLIMKQKYWFSAKSRSLDQVIKVYSKTASSKTTEEAKRFILEGIFNLKPENFFKSGLQWGLVTDIYGLNFDARPWYVKFAIADEEEDGKSEPWLQEISFHPPEEAFVTQGGIEIAGSESNGGIQL